MNDDLTSHLIATKKRLEEATEKLRKWGYAEDANRQLQILNEQLEKAQATASRYRKALEPFARMAKDHKCAQWDYVCLNCGEAWPCMFQKAANTFVGRVDDL